IQSAWGWTCQDGDSTRQALASLLTNPPLPSLFASQSVIAPLSFCQMMSSLPSPSKSPVPTMCQLVGTTSQALGSLLANPPFAWPSHSVNDPLSLRQSTSFLPSPLKSPVPATCQLVGTTFQALASLLVKPPLPSRFASHSVKEPLSLRQRISSLPSPSKSPVPTTCQSVGTLVKALASLLAKPPVDWPSHSVNDPSSLRQMTSSLPSPLKSPVPATCQLVASTRQAFASLLVKPPLPSPFASQSVIEPSSFCQMMSSLPSPLKSPVPTICQL